MKTTLQSVIREATARGLESVAVDGIPDGFAWRRPDVTIGGTHYEGNYIAYVPLSNPTREVFAPIPELLVELYTLETAKK